MYAVKKMMKKILKRRYMAQLQNDIGTKTITPFSAPSSESNETITILPGEGSVFSDVRTEDTTEPEEKKGGFRKDSTVMLPRDQPDCYIENEIAILKRIRHPNIVRLHEVIDDREEDLIYLVWITPRGALL